MFGTNPSIGQSYFREHALSNELIVTSLFATLQGEGPLSGQRSVFLRLSHCQLSCNFCDTYFSAEDKYQFEELRDALLVTVNDWSIKHNVEPFFTQEELDSQVGFEAYDLLSTWNLVVTGGEPLLQANLFPFLAELQDGYSPKPLFKRIQIESNGLLPVEDSKGTPFLDDEVILVVSPKCNERNGVAIKHLNPHKTTLARASCLKFVITADQESGYSRIPDWALEWRDKTGRPIYLSPMNMYLREPLSALMAAKSNRQISIKERSEVLERISFWESGLLDMEKNRANHEYTALLCMKYDCILSLQTHLLASLP